jgi:hypothetical protein
MKKDSALERLVYRMVTRNLDKHSIDNYTDAVKKQEAFATTTAFQTIDTKATGLLTYVAMMIAGLGLVAPLVADSDLEIGIIIAEMTAYLLIAVGCLRCLSVVGGRDVSGADIEQRLTRELLVRRELLALCNRTSIILTVVVFVLLPIQFFYAPPK